MISTQLQVGPGDKQRQGAKDTHLYPWLTWLTVRYWLGTGTQVLASVPQIEIEIAFENDFFSGEDE
jgi:hypothetical protein